MPTGEMGVPNLLVGNLSRIYDLATLRIGNMWVRQGTGVLLGNPLSTLLFNIVTDYIF